MKKISRMNEAAWVIGIVGCALGVCLCTKADFGLSMIAAPPYIFHLALRDRLPWYTQGTSEYLWQGVLLLVMCVATGRFRWKYLLSFGTAVISGLCIDFWFLLLGGNGPYESLWLRICFPDIVAHRHLRAPGPRGCRPLRAEHQPCEACK